MVSPLQSIRRVDQRHPLALTPREIAKLSEDCSLWRPDYRATTAPVGRPTALPGMLEKMAKLYLSATERPGGYLIGLADAHGLNRASLMATVGRLRAERERASAAQQLPA